MAPKTSSRTANDNDASSNDHLSLCLTSSRGRQIVALSKSTATVKDLYDVATKAFDTTISSLKYGFPPKRMELEESTNLSTLVHNQERIQVEFGTNQKSFSKQTLSSTTTASNADQQEENEKGQRGKRPPRRAAAKAASKAMPDRIRAQEEMMQPQQQVQPSRRSRTTKSNNSLVSSQKRASTTATPKFTAAGNGRRVADGAVIQNTKRRRGNSSSQQQAKSSDLSEALLGALNNKGKMGQVLRKGMKNAVQASYETSRAFSRLSSIQAKSYHMVPVDSELQITFSGSVDKAKVEENVDCIPKNVLEAVLRGIYASNPEALRPENLALLSPRVLWSLVHEYPTTNSIVECYQQLLPDLEWNFLHRRAQQLSEKAMENLRQQQEQQQGHEEDDMINIDHASEAIHAVEHAMEHLHDYESTERKAKLAKAALRRQQQQTNHDNDGSIPSGNIKRQWNLITPSEPDRDELTECIQAAPPSVDSQIPKLVTKLMDTCHIRNWRELANVTEPSQLTRQLVNDGDDSSTRLNVATVEKWIEYAQDQSVEEIIVEICNGNPTHVERLIEHARTGTPKDLAAWRCIPEELKKLLPGSEDISITELSTWCNRAYSLLQEIEWLNWYATPIE